MIQYIKSLRCYSWFKEHQSWSTSYKIFIILVSKILSLQHFIYLGNPDAKRPQYDIESISQYVDFNLINQVSASLVEKNSSFKEKTPPLPPLSERSPYVLPTVLGIAVAILAFLLLRLVTKLKKSSPEEPPPSNLSV